MVKPLLRLPIHPQWYTKTGTNLISQLKNIPPEEIILDIGCYDKWVTEHINNQCTYIGLDYYETAKTWYFSKPDVFGDAHYLPFQSEQFSKILLLDVLEHLENLDLVLAEIHRTLQKNGEAIIQIPFLYPVHDAPRDFTRLTKYGFRKKAETIGFEIISEKYSGSPLQTAALLKNLAIAKTFIGWIKQKNPLCLLTPLLPFYFLFQNLTSYCMSKLAKSDDFMPFSYLFVIKK